MTGGAALRLAVRGPLFLVVSTVLAVAAHLAGGGERPDAAAVLQVALIGGLGLLAFTGAPVARPLPSARPLPPARLVALLGGVQAVAHLVLRDPDHDHVVAGAGRAHPAMLLAHTVAVVLLALWLHRGEAAACRALTRIVCGLPAVTCPAPAVDGVRRGPAPAHRTRARRRRPDLRVVGLRAPPQPALG